MGAYEFGGDPELDCNGNSIADSCCPGDISGDGVVDAFDLAQLLGAWGSPGCDGAPQCCADLSGDGDVEAFDLAQLLGDWGPCP